MEQSNRDQAVVVAGASVGAGLALVREFARYGAHLGLIARGRERSKATRREVEETGGMALALPTDVAAAQHVEAAAECVERESGPLRHLGQGCDDARVCAVSRDGTRSAPRKSPASGKSTEAWRH